MITNYTIDQEIKGGRNEEEERKREKSCTTISLLCFRLYDVRLCCFLIKLASINLFVVAAGFGLSQLLVLK